MNESEFDHAVTNRHAARELAARAAIEGNPVCGAMFVLESEADQMGLGFLATTAQDYASEENDEDDIRPY